MSQLAKGLIFDLDGRVSAANEVGDDLFKPASAEFEHCTEREVSEGEEAVVGGAAGGLNRVAVRARQGGWRVEIKRHAATLGRLTV